MVGTNVVKLSQDVGMIGGISVERFAYIRQVELSVYNTPLFPYNVDRITRELEEFFRYSINAENPKNIIFLEDFNAYRKLMNTVYKDIAPLLMTNSDGKVNYVNAEGLFILARYVMRLGNDKQKEYLKALLLAGHHHALQVEMKAIRKETKTKGLNLSSFTCDTRRFGVNKLPFVQRKYMEHIVVDENPEHELAYKYTYSCQHLFYVALVGNLLGLPLEKAKELVASRKQGLFIPFLTIEEEVKVVKFIVDFKLYKYQDIFSGAIFKQNPSLYETIAGEYSVIDVLANTRDNTLTNLGDVVRRLSYLAHDRGNTINIYSLTDTQLSFQTEKPIANIDTVLASQVKQITGFPYDLYNGYL